MLVYESKIKNGTFPSHPQLIYPIIKIRELDIKIMYKHNILSKCKAVNSLQAAPSWINPMKSTLINLKCSFYGNCEIFS